MDRYKYLIKNIGLLTLSSFATKLLSLFLIPLYTNILTTIEYGTYDLFNTTIGVLLPILTMNIQDSVLRFSLDNKYDQKAIVSIGSHYLLTSNVCIVLGLSLNYIWGFNTILKEYSVFFFLMFFVQSLSGLVTAYIRGIDRIADLSVSSVIASLITICCNLFFIAVFRWGLVGYFLANVLGPLIQCGYLVFRADIIHYEYLRKDYSEEKQAMLDYCRPMIVNSIAWWVNNASDRYVLIFFCGLAENGIYSVASKIPSILNIFQSIFSQAWTLSAVKEFDPEDKNEFFSNTYKAYNCLMVVLCSAIIALDKILSKFLYAKDFFTAWKYVPWLTIAIVFGALSGYIGGFFAAMKNSKIFAQSSIIGAVTNVILNIIFTPFIGGLGAAIATAVCYFEVWAARYWYSRKCIKMKINLFRDIISYIILVLQSVTLLCISNSKWLYRLEIGLFTLIMLLYVGDMNQILNKGRRTTKKERQVKE